MYYILLIMSKYPDIVEQVYINNDTLYFKYKSRRKFK